MAPNRARTPPTRSRACFALVRERYGGRLAPGELEEREQGRRGDRRGGAGPPRGAAHQRRRAGAAVRAVPRRPVMAEERRLRARAPARRAGPRRAASRRSRWPRHSSTGWRRSARATTPWSRSRASARWRAGPARGGEIAAGRYRGPLHGIPYGAKDLLATAGGIPTTWGAAPLRGPRVRLRRDRHPQARGGGRGAVRQARDGGAGRRHGLSPAQRVVHRPGREPVEPRRVERRLVERLGLGGRRGLVPVRHRLGDLGLDPLARAATAASPACGRPTGG